MRLEKTRMRKNSNKNAGFSLTELMIAMTITLVVVGMAFYLLAQSLHRKSRAETQTEALADANQALGIMSKEITNAGFGLTSNGLSAADCTEDKIRVRANLNSLMKQTTSGTVNDQDEDVIFQLIANPDGGSALVRTDVGLGQSSVVSTQIDNTDINGDGDGDGLTFSYLDESGNAVAPQNAARVQVVIRVRLPQVGQPGAPGFQPEITKQLSSSVVLRNSRLLAY
jgi:prepilin-type N-terminal cleavage/methylation domain-containing protein